MKANAKISGMAVLALLAWGCGAGSSDRESGPYNAPPSNNAPTSVGLAPPGAKDFGLFRALLDAGEIPGPQTLDDLGFFAEHKLVFPDATCGESVCLHALLGVMGNLIDGVNCTLITVGLNTPLNPATMPRPPLHVVVSIDTSGSMGGDPILYVRSGLKRMLDNLEPEDRISVVTYSDTASILAEALLVSEHKAALQNIADSIVAGGSTNIFDGLVTAFDLAAAHFDPSGQNRVIMLSDGVATAGITSSPKMVDLARTYAKQAIGLTTIGVGTDFDVGLMRALGEVGAGNFYFVEDPKAVVEVFTDEIKVFMVPLATDVRIDVSVGPAYSLREAFGTSSWQTFGNGGTIEIPALFLAGRTDTGTPPPTGRRGGGGAMLIEVMPNGQQAIGDEGYRVGTVTISWTDPNTGNRLEQVATVLNSEMPGQWPPLGVFSHPVSEKAFVMLNLFVGLRIASRLATDGDFATALGALRALEEGVQGWLWRNEDGDIADDLQVVNQFISVLTNKAPAIVAVPPPTPWPYD